MKRIFFLLFLVGCILPACAEQMTFVTTLSSPLGTFAQLETADYSATTSVPLLNFCNTRASVGTVTLKGADTYLQTLSLKNGTTLGGNTPEYRISGTLSVNNNSEVTGGRLLANTATVSGASSAKSKVEDTLYAASLKVKGAKAASLTIPGQVETSGQGGDDELEWSNIYTKDYKSDGSTTGSNSYTSYLLKSKGENVCTGTPPVDSRECGCPGGTQPAIYECDSSGQWVRTGWGTCSKPRAEELSCSWKLQECYFKSGVSRKDAALYLANQYLSSSIVTQMQNGGIGSYALVEYEDPGYQVVHIYNPLNADTSYWKDFIPDIEKEANDSAALNAAGIEDEPPTHYLMYPPNQGGITVDGNEMCIDEAVCTYCPE